MQLRVILMLVLLLQSTLPLVSSTTPGSTIEDLIWKFLNNFLNPQNSNRPQCSVVNTSFCDVSHIVYPDVTGWVMAFGDFNSDRFTDMFVSDGSHFFMIYLWRTASWSFERVLTQNVTGIDHIDNIIAFDINYDGRLDVLVQGHKEGESVNRMVWYQGNYSHLTYRSEIPYSDGQVSVMDYNGDVVPDLVGNRNNSRHVWVNDPPGNFTVVRMDINADTPFSKSNTNAFLDFNGDCMADLFFAKDGDNGTVYEILVRHVSKKTWKYMYESLQSVPGAGKVSFFDMNSDGSVDAIIPVCYPENDCSLENSVRVIYNVQQEICQNFLSKNCVSSQSLCISGGTDFTFQNFNENPGPDVVITNINNTFYYKKEYGLSIHHGDFNLDGYPDILITVGEGKDSHVELWENIPCNQKLCTQEAIQKSRRAFQYFGDRVEALEKIKYPVAAVFVDLDEDGINDILVLSEDGTNKKVHALENNYASDNFFLKTLGLNGVCTERCSEGEFLPDPKPYGVNQFGATFRFTYTTLDAVRQMRQIPQLSQSSFLSLQTPYTLSGLGRPSNYIDYLFMGLPGYDKDRFNSWPGLIPNSQVVAIPYPVSKTDNWLIELYLAPSSLTLYIFIAVVVALIINGIVICILSMNEKEEDKSDRPLLLSTMA